jgi:diacylglycerol kinase family enzyme
VLDDGLLDIVLARESPRGRYLRGLPKVFRGTHVDSRELVFRRGREIAFEADRPFPVYADGDPLAGLPVPIRVVPRALKVLVP